MRRNGWMGLVTAGLVLLIVFCTVSTVQAIEKKLNLNNYKVVVIKPFESTVKGALGLPAATQDCVTQALKESAMFGEVTTVGEKPAQPAAPGAPTSLAATVEGESSPAASKPPAAMAAEVKSAESKPKLEEAKLVTATKAETPKTPKTLVLEAKLVDFEPGSAAKRLMVGFGSGRAHAGFEFTLKDADTGEVLWTKVVKQTASFWFNGTTSSAAERAELPEGVAKKFMEELRKVAK